MPQRTAFCLLTCAFDVFEEMPQRTVPPNSSRKRIHVEPVGKMGIFLAVKHVHILTIRYVYFNHLKLLYHPKYNAPLFSASLPSPSSISFPSSFSYDNPMFLLCKNGESGKEMMKEDHRKVKRSYREERGSNSSSKDEIPNSVSKESRKTVIPSVLQILKALLSLDIMDCGSDMLIYIRWMILFTMMDKYNEKWLFAHVTM
ncbi:CHD3-type chromatin-remodeling factor PICKLE [Senna tora]|uniref:CHD3-type chromatin-remodeling factor PICKLE n=1 Tax=Senna tora TaxID=362788 RepID=A0A834XBZ0_9FABA|nr:CHD3-type chromatin-remodeling factor PICKLE [Senna tora]